MIEATESGTRQGRWWTALALTPLLRWLTIRHSVTDSDMPRLSCPDCGAVLSPGHRSASPLAKCLCGRRLGPAPFSVEVTTAVLLVLVVLSPWTVWEQLGFAWWIGCWIVLSHVDVAVHRLPYALSHASAAGLLVFLAVAAVATGELSRLGWAAAGGVVVWGLLAVGAMFGSSGLGGGDVRAGLSIGIAAGWVSLFAVFSALFLAGVVMIGYGIWLMARGRGTLKSAAAFGPSMFVGTMLAVVLLEGMLRPA